MSLKVLLVIGCCWWMFLLQVTLWSLKWNPFLPTLSRASRNCTSRASKDSTWRKFLSRRCCLKAQRRYDHRHSVCRPCGRNGLPYGVMYVAELCSTFSFCVLGSCCSREKGVWNCSRIWVRVLPIIYVDILAAILHVSLPLRGRSVLFWVNSDLSHQLMETSMWRNSPFRGLPGGEENGMRGYMLTFVIAYLRVSFHDFTWFLWCISGEDLRPCLLKKLNCWTLFKL